MHTMNVNTKVNTATRESDEQFKTDRYLRYAVTDGDERLDFIPALFFTPSADNMAASWLRQHSDYNGGFWSYWIIPQGVGGNITPGPHSVHHHADRVYRTGRKTILQDAHPRQLF